MATAVGNLFNAATSTTEKKQQDAPPKISSSIEDDFNFGVSVATSSKQVRLGFLRKVYGILSAQLLLTTVVSALFMSCAPIKTFVQGSSAMLYFSMFLGFGTLIPLLALRKTAPWNFRLLALFTLAESYMIGTVVTFYDVDVVIQAFLITATITVGLTLFTFQTKRDFTPLLSSMVSILWVMVLGSFLQVFFPLSSTAEFIYSCFGAAFFSVFIIVDTQMMMNKLSSDEYILCAINLYLDILNLFLEILKILNKK